MERATLYQCEECGAERNGPLYEPYHCHICGHDRLRVLVDTSKLQGGS